MASNMTTAEAGQVGAKTLWIGDVEPWMDDAYISSLFSGIASVQTVKLIRDKLKGTPVGYGFVEFPNHDVARNVYLTLNGSVIPGTTKSYKLNWATHGNGGIKQIQNQPQSQPPHLQMHNQNPQMMNQGGPGGAQQQQQGDFQIYVGDLDPNVNDQMLLNVFNKKYPSVTQAKVIVDPVTRYSKGYGFVKFGSQEESQNAMVEMQGYYLFKKPMKINQANAIQRREGGGGGGGGHHHPPPQNYNQGGGYGGGYQQQHHPIGGQYGGPPPYQGYDQYGQYGGYYQPPPPYGGYPPPAYDQYALAPPQAYYPPPVHHHQPPPPRPPMHQIPPPQLAPPLLHADQHLSDQSKALLPPGAGLIQPPLPTTQPPAGYYPPPGQVGYYPPPPGMYPPPQTTYGAPPMGGPGPHLRNPRYDGSGQDMHGSGGNAPGQYHQLPGSANKNFKKNQIKFTEKEVDQMNYEYMKEINEKPEVMCLY
eukprot:403359035